MALTFTGIVRCRAPRCLDVPWVQQQKRPRNCVRLSVPVRRVPMDYDRYRWSELT